MSTSVKMIKFDLNLKGVKITNLEQLQDNFSADILPIFQSGRLAKWFKSRDLSEQAIAIEGIGTVGSELEQLKGICQVLGLDDDAEVLQFLLDDRVVAQAIPAAVASDVEEAELEEEQRRMEIEERERQLEAEEREKEIEMQHAKASAEQARVLAELEAIRKSEEMRISLHDILHEHRSLLCTDNSGVAPNWFPVFCVAQ